LELPLALGFEDVDLRSEEPVVECEEEKKDLAASRETQEHDFPGELQDMRREWEGESSNFLEDLGLVPICTLENGERLIQLQPFV
jgi:hypothetical protein